MPQWEERETPFQFSLSALISRAIDKVVSMDPPKKTAKEAPREFYAINPKGQEPTVLDVNETIHSEDSSLNIQLNDSQYFEKEPIDPNFKEYYTKVMQGQ